VRFRPLVLCYHAVSAGWSDPLAVEAATLERQLRLLLRSGLRSITAGEVLENPRRSFHVTFDDAYRSTAAAVPVLERLGVSASLFVCTKYARDGCRFDVPELHDRTGDDLDELLTMPWETLRELAARGVEIGSHTVSHPHLPHLTDAALRHELADSRAEIEAELGRPCRFVAYPYGDDDGRVHAAARAAGYTAAYTLRGSAWHPNALALRRVDVYRGDGATRFAAKATPAGGPAMAASAAIRRVRNRHGGSYTR
jgi:peptidoglycan/xylan/chitin deacetylase (PgdA/CDA1 family)